MIPHSFWKAAIGALSVLVLGESVQAIPITGAITYISGAVPDNTNLNLATSFSFSSTSFVVGATGDLAGVGGSVVNAPGVTGLPLGLGTAPLSVPVLSLWSGGGFNFDLFALDVDFRSSTQFTASGTGTITGPAGYDPTPATWTLAITGAGPVLGLAAGSEATVGGEPVPEGGSSVLLLSLGLIGLGLYRRPKIAVGAEVLGEVGDHV